MVAVKHSGRYRSVGISRPISYNNGAWQVRVPLNPAENGQEIELGFCVVKGCCFLHIVAEETTWIIPQWKESLAASKVNHFLR